MRPCISIRGLVRPLVGWSVGEIFRILNDMVLSIVTLFRPLVGNAFIKVGEKWAFTYSR